MKKVLLTGKFNGVIQLHYDVDSRLCCIDLREAELEEKQVQYLYRNIPLHYDKVMEFATQLNLRAVEENIELTFDMFYDKYGHKVGKAAAQRSWKRLNKGDRVDAFMFIKTYLHDLKINTWKNQMNPATYLNQRPLAD